MIAKLRAWLIDLVREAIRIERTAESYRPFANEPSLSDPALKIETVRMKTVKGFDLGFDFVAGPHRYAAKDPGPQVLHLDQSFEQIQVNAIAEQEKYYEPKSD